MATGKDRAQQGAQQYTAAHDQSGGGNRYGHDGQVGRPAGSTRQ
jgi:hypothetical protein